MESLCLSIQCYSCGICGETAKRPAHLLVEQPKFALKKAAQGGEKREDANSHQKNSHADRFFGGRAVF